MQLAKWARLLGRTAAAVCPYSLSLLLRQPRQVRAFLSTVAKAAFAFGGARIRPLDADDLPVDDTPVRLPSALFSNAKIDPGEYGWLARLARSVAPKRIFEIGTLHGVSALTLAQNCPEATICTLDLPLEHDPQATALGTDRELVVRRGPIRVFDAEPERERIVTLTGDSLEFDFGPYCGSMDVVFVDGAHEWRWVESDSQNALRMVAPGGMVIWHDYGHRGEAADVTEYLEALDRQLGGRLRWVRGTSLVFYPAAGHREGVPIHGSA